MVKVNDRGGAAIKVDGHDAELAMHDEGFSIDECWEEEDGTIRTREHHWFGVGHEDRRFVLDNLTPDTTGETVRRLGFETLEREPLRLTRVKTLDQAPR